MTDWIFNLQDGGDHSAYITAADPTSDVSLDEPSAQDIINIFGEGSTNDYDCGDSWVYGELKDGRFFFYSEWADYTFSGASLVLAKTREEIERYGLGQEERKALGIVLPDLEA